MCVCHASTRHKGGNHGWGLKFTFETPIKNKVPTALLPKIPPCRGRCSPSARGSGGRGSPGGGAGRALFRRPAKLGPWEAAGRAGPRHATEVTLGAEFLKPGTRLLLQSRHQTGPWVLGELRHIYPSSVRHLKHREQAKPQPPVSLKLRPLLGDRFGCPDCNGFLPQCDAYRFTYQASRRIYWSCNLRGSYSNYWEMQFESPLLFCSSCLFSLLFALPVFFEEVTAHLGRGLLC